MKNLILLSYDAKVVKSLICDICKEEYPKNWGANNYEVRETSVSMEIGNTSQDGGASEKMEFDICPKCFQEKLVPMLQSMGVEPNLVDDSW